MTNDLDKLIYSRHSVRKYTSQPIPFEIVEALNNEIELCNDESGLHIQLVINDCNVFSRLKVSYGLLTGVKNYIVLVGPKSVDLDEKLGYYGERIVLKAQELGLNTCWIGLSALYKTTKGCYRIDNGEKKRLIIAVGYGENQGHSRPSKSFDEVVKIEDENIPEWFKKGIDYALLAPTATNQQKFIFELKGNEVTLKHGIGFFSRVDKGIVKYHFELGAGKDNFVWKK